MSECTYLSTVIRNIKGIMKEKNITADELADRLGYANRSVVDRHLGGKRMQLLNVSLVYRYAKALDVNPSEILEGTSLPDLSQKELYCLLPVIGWLPIELTMILNGMISIAQGCIMALGIFLVSFLFSLFARKKLGRIIMTRITPDDAFWIASILFIIPIVLVVIPMMWLERAILILTYTWFMSFISLSLFQIPDIFKMSIKSSYKAIATLFRNPSKMTYREHLMILMTMITVVYLLLMTHEYEFALAGAYLYFGVIVYWLALAIKRPTAKGYKT